tara:strand:- start:1888 stop:3021 length:1134 start_codon:yes stop_codon:yes gene_type:complete
MSQRIDIKKVSTKGDYQTFVEFPFALYKDNPFWVPPLVKDEIETLDPKLNPVYQNATASLFIAYKNGEVVGRVAAIINWIEVKEIKKNKVRFGWFDFVDDINVSKTLLEAVIAFGKNLKMETIEGPVGFSNLDKAGMLIEGFNEPNTIITLYNFPYYSKHLEKLGFNVAAKWVEYEIKIDDFESSPERVKRFSKLIMDKYELTLLNFKKRKDIIPYVDQMFELLDKTYNQLQTYVPIQDYQIENYKKRFLKFVNPDYIKCIIDKEGKLICFSITMPSFTEALKKINGKITILNTYYLLKAMRKNNRASFYLIGVHPEYQNKGITAIIFNEMQKLFNKKQIISVETNPELEENTAIQKLWKNYEHRLHKRRATYNKSI